MVVPNRSGSSGSYRYGFQGQEKDNEIRGGEGNSMNYTFRMHDPRIGRFFARDPLENKYPFFSPYQFSANTPIMAIELEGLESSNDPNQVQIPFTNNESPKAEFGPQNSIFANQTQLEEVVIKPENSSKSPTSYKYRLFFGKDLGSFFKDLKPTIYSLSGGPDYYTTNGGLDEPNNNIQFQFGKFTAIYFKQKLEEFANGYRIEAGSAIEFGVRLNKTDFVNYRGIVIGLESFVTAGPTISVAEFKNGIDQVYNSGPSLKFGGVNYFRGGGGSVMLRLEASFKNYGFYTSAILHGWHSIDQKTSLGTQPGMFFGSFAIYSGFSLSIGNEKNNKD
jgi:RHS repeat-associated protein